MLSLNGKNGLKDMPLMANIALEINEKPPVAHRSLRQRAQAASECRQTPCVLPLERLVGIQITLNVQGG